MGWDSSIDPAVNTAIQARQAPPTAPPAGSGAAAADPIPGSGGYAAQEALAERAYQEAVAQLTQQRNSLYHQYGLTTSGSVDPHSQFGEYQSMLGNEGSALDQARNDAAGRGLGVGGLANQGEKALKTADNTEHLQFQEKVDQEQHNYDNSLINAKTQEQGSILAAEQGAYNNALTQGLFNQPPPSVTPTQAPTAPAAPSSAAGSDYNYSKTLLQQYLTGGLYSRKSRSNPTGLTGQGRRGIITIH